MTVQFRDYQIAAVESIFNYYRTNNGNPIVAMPTGTGKSLVIGGFVWQSFMRFGPAQNRLLMLTHVKELIEQNARQLQRVWPQAPLGIYSAGLNQKDTMQPIIYGGVRSVVNNLPAFGYRDAMLVDEGHLISPKGGTTYQKIIDYFTNINPNFRVIMFTATPYRVGQGMLTDGKNAIATDICFDITDTNSFNRLIAEGYLAPLISFPKEIGVDFSNFNVVNGDFNQRQVEDAFDITAITERALAEVLRYGHNRRCWLIFASGKDHAEHIAGMLMSYGIVAAAIHDGLSSAERTARLRAFKAGQIRCLVNYNILTTGFDFAPIDLIVMLRATMSPGLWVQMLGRGTRPYNPNNPGDVDPRRFPDFKQNCLVLDFGRNGKRLGPINDVKIPGQSSGKKGRLPVRDCLKCGCENHISARVCVNCGEPFTFEVKIDDEVTQDELLRGDTPVVEWFDIERVFYMKYTTRTKGEDVLKASYYCTNGKNYTELVFFGHPRMAGKARSWFRQRHSADPIPNTVDEALRYNHEFRQPSRIKVWTNKNYPEILSVEFNTWDSNGQPILRSGWNLGQS
jgi:DNA repair protein RadD